MPLKRRKLALLTVELSVEFVALVELSKRSGTSGDSSMTTSHEDLDVTKTAAAASQS
jgi:hypothetical protein